MKSTFCGLTGQRIKRQERTLRLSSWNPRVYELQSFCYLVVAPYFASAFKLEGKTMAVVIIIQCFFCI